MLAADIETKWLRFKTALLDLVENFCPLAWPNRLLAKPYQDIKTYYFDAKAEEKAV